MKLPIRHLLSESLKLAAYFLFEMEWPYRYGILNRQQGNDFRIALDI